MIVIYTKNDGLPVNTDWFISK